MLDSSGIVSDVSLASVILPGSNNVQCVGNAFFCDGVLTDVISGLWPAV